jgi:hypothetical protein
MTTRQKLATRILCAVIARRWGLPPSLIREMTIRMGAGATLTWFVKNLPRYEVTRTKWGVLRIHLACIAVSLLNGCSYCTYAHAYAFELAYFQERGRLFPLDEYELVRLRNGTDEELRAALVGLLGDNGLAKEVPVVDRLWGLKFDGLAPANDDDRRMKHLLEMFDVLNYCAIDSRVPLDEAHDPINKDQGLKLRYAEARLAAGPRD